MSLLKIDRPDFLAVGAYASACLVGCASSRFAHRRSRYTPQMITSAPFLEEFAL